MRQNDKDMAVFLCALVLTVLASIAFIGSVVSAESIVVELSKTCSKRKKVDVSCICHDVDPATRGINYRDCISDGCQELPKDWACNAHDFSGDGMVTAGDCLWRAQLCLEATVSSACNQ